MAGAAVPPHTGAPLTEPTHIYDLAGGEEGFRQLVDRFYEGVAADPVLRPLYPEEDLSGAAERLRLFLVQYFGGPATYSERRGHPRLRLRHQPFVIGRKERDAWLRHMREAVGSLDLAPEVASAFLDYFDRASLAMMNALTG